MVATLAVRDGGGGGRALVRTVAVDDEESVLVVEGRVRLSVLASEDRRGTLFELSPVEVEARAEGFVGFGGGRFVPVAPSVVGGPADVVGGVTNEPVVLVVDATEARDGVRSSLVKGVGVLLRGAGGGGGVLVDD